MRSLKIPGVGEMAQWLGVLVALAKDLSFVPTLTIGDSQKPVTPAPGDPDALFWSSQASIHMCT